jgi:hypothetical protein
MIRVFSAIYWYQDDMGQWRIVFQRDIGGQTYGIWYSVDGPERSSQELERLADEALRGAGG